MCKSADGTLNSVLALAFSPDGTKLASGSKDKTVRLWDTYTNKELMTLRKHTGWTNVLAFSPDGKTLASGSTDKTIQLWDTATGAHLATFTKHRRGDRGISVFTRWTDPRQWEYGWHNSVLEHDHQNVATDPSHRTHGLG